MQSTIERQRVRKLALVVTLVVAALSAALSTVGQSAQAPGAQATVGVTNTTILSNDRVSVIRQTLAVGARVALHPPNFDIVITQIDAGEAEWQIGDEKTSGHQEPGKVWFLKKGTQHAIVNLGQRPFDLQVVVLK